MKYRPSLIGPMSLTASLLLVATSALAEDNAGVPQSAESIKTCTKRLIGSHATFDVGPGKTYSELDGVPFGKLAAGDVVNIYARPAAYKSKFGLRAQGTRAAPVVINGVTDAECRRPVLDFDGATTAKGSNPGGGKDVFGTPAIYNESLAGIIIKRGPSGQDAYGKYVPRWIIIQGLHLQGARKGATYTSLAGKKEAYGSAACLWVQQGEDILLRNNIVTDCAFGIFLMAKDELLSETTQRVTIANNRIYDNGVAGSYSEHGLYVQAASPVVEGNFIGRVRANSEGSSYKSRASGEIFRHNYIVCSAFCMDFVQSEEQANGIVRQQNYGTDYVYGNTIVSDGGGIHYGGDNMGEQERGQAVFVPPVPYRKHLLFWNNHLILTTATYRTWLFKLSAKETVMDAWNNTFIMNFTGVGELSWLFIAGQLRLGADNVVKGHAVVDAQGDSGATVDFYEVTKGNGPIPDPALQLLK